MEKGIAPLPTASAAMPPSPSDQFGSFPRMLRGVRSKNRGGVHGCFYFVKRNIILIYQWFEQLAIYVNRIS